MRIRSFFVLLTATISGLLILVAGALIVNTTRMYEKANLHARALESISVADEIKLALLAHARDASLAAQIDGTRYQSLQAAEERQILEKLVEARRYVTSPEEDDILVRMAAETKQYLERLGTNSQSGPRPDNRSPNMAQANDLDRLIDHIDSFIAINRQQASEAAQDVSAWDAVSNTIGRAALGVVLLIGVGIMLFFRKLIYLPLKQLNDTIVSFAHGKFTARADHNGPLEIREIGSAFNEMSDMLAESRQRQLQFLAGVVHDLKNPLTAIKGYTDLLLFKHTGNNELAGSLHIILNQIDRLNVMLHDLLDATSIEAGRLEITKSEFDIRPILQRSVDLFSSTSPLHTVRYDAPPAAMMVFADGLRLEQVFGNLISNAIKYSPAGGDIQVRLERKDKSVQIQVTDQGLGLSPDEFDRIFQPFARSKSTRDAIPGVGLGLSVSRKIVRALGGEIFVESVPGQGSTFTVSLPQEPVESRTTA